MSTLTLQQVQKTYHHDCVIHPMDVAIKDGEFIVIVGESGCGKSTLLRMIAGLEQTSAGAILIDDVNVTAKEPKDRDIAMVFQNYALYPHMTVYDNIAYGLKVRKVAKAEILQRVTKIAQMLKLDQLLERKPNALSGGQRQRVAMGRAIIRNPKLFLFDEPLSNLDARLRVEMRLEIKKLQQELAITSLYVTHDQVEAMTMADRIIILNKGKIEQFDTPEMVYKRPASMFVAGFIGAPAMNFIPAKTNKNGIMLENGTAIPVKLNTNHKTNQEFIIGIRPEHISLSADASDLALRVDNIEYLGGETLLYGIIDKTNIRLTVKVEDHWQGAIGSEVHLELQQEYLLMFDPVSRLLLP